MLFVAEDARCGSLLTGVVAPYVRTAFGRLLTAHLDGLHLLVASPLICRAIEKLDLFSFDQRVAAGKVRAKYAEQGALSDQLRCWANLIDENVSPYKLGEVWQVPLQWIADRPLHELQLVGEDLNDIVALVQAAEDFKTDRKLFSFSVRVNHVPGGGINTHRVLADKAIDQQRITLCIVDSDRETPGGNLGSSASACLAVAGPGLFQVTTTFGRSIENSIPWKLLDKVRPAMRPKPTQLLSDLDKVTPRASQFANLKRGCFRFDVDRLEELPPKGFWADIERYRVSRTACCNDVCQAAEIGRCRDRVFVGCGSSTLPEVGATLQLSKRDPTRSKEYLPSPNGDEWLALGQETFEYGLAPTPRRI